MIFKSSKSLLPPPFLLFCIVIFSACTMLSPVSETEKDAETKTQASITLTISSELEEKVAAAASRSVSTSGTSLSDYLMDISMKGDYEEMSTIYVKAGSKVTFSNVKIGADVYLTGFIYQLTQDSSGTPKRKDLFSGSSSHLQVKKGENQITLQLKKVQDESGSGSSTSGGAGGQTPEGSGSTGGAGGSSDTGSSSGTGGTGTGSTGTGSGESSESTGSGATGTGSTGSGSSGTSGSAGTGSGGSSSSSGSSGSGASSGAATPVATTYTVREWWQATEGDGYALHDSYTVDAESGSKTQAAAKTYTGFTAQTPIEQQTIDVDGTTIVNIYYDRLTYTITYNSNGKNSINIPSSRTYRYGAMVQVSFDTSDVTGFVLNGWFTDAACTTLYDSTEPVTGEFTLYAKWLKAADSGITVIFNYYQTDINVTMEKEGSVYTFTAPVAGQGEDPYEYEWYLDGQAGPTTNEVTIDVSNDYFVAGVPYDLVLYLTNSSGTYSYYVQIIKD